MIRPIGWLLGVLVMLAPMAARAQDACGTVWRSVNDPVAGATYEMAADPRREYFITYGDKFPATSQGQGFLKEVSCATFSVAVWDLEGKQVGDTKAFFDAYQAQSMRGGSNNKLYWSRSLTVGGYPARDFLTSLNIDLFGTLTYYRTLAVLRGDKVLLFNSHWSGGQSDAIADRYFRSIRLVTPGPAQPLRTYGLLSEAITKYWMFTYKNHDFTQYFTPALLARLETRKAQDAEVIKAFGYPRTFTLVSNAATGKVVRVKHDDATVDWTVTQAGPVFSAITWKKVDPNAPVARPAAATTAATATTTPTRPANLAAITAAQNRFVQAIVTSPALGTRFTVATQTDKCRTKYALLPPGKTPEEVLQKTFNIDWRIAKSITFKPGTPDADAWWKDYVEVADPTGGTWPLHPGKEQVGAMLSAGNELIALCKGTAPM